MREKNLCRSKMEHSVFRSESMLNDIQRNPLQ